DHHDDPGDHLRCPQLGEARTVGACAPPVARRVFGPATWHPVARYVWLSVCLTRPGAVLAGFSGVADRTGGPGGGPHCPRLATPSGAPWSGPMAKGRFMW